MFYCLRAAIAIAFVLPFLSVHAQLENHTWYFSGTNVGMSFDLVTNAMSVTNVHVPLDIQGNSVASDPVTGQVLFYSNGINVYDAGHQQMPNGFGLNSNASCTQKGPVGFVPGQCGRYYIFTNSANDLVAGNISYSVVDMSLPGNGTASNPKGDIVFSSKNIYITGQACEAITVVPGTHNNNYWLLVPRINSDSIRVFSVTASGIAFSGSYSSGYYLSNPRSIRYSQAAGKIAMMSMIEAQPAYVMNFNPATGVLSNAAVVTGTPLLSNTNQFHGFVDAEFSPDGTKLYLAKYRDSSPTAAGKLYQYDLNNPAAPLTLIYAIPSTSWVHWGGGLKLGPDGKIYWLKVNENNTSRFIGVVNSPNIAGNGCSFNPNGVDVLVDMGPTTKFSACLFYQNAPPIALADTISINVPCGQQSDTVFIFPLGNDSDADGDQLSVSILSVGAGGATLLPNNIIRYITPSTYVGSDMLSYIVCDDQCRTLCDTAQVTININNQSPPQNFLGNDVILCSGQSVTINTALQGQHTWSTGATGSFITINNPGTYWVEVSAPACTSRDTIVVTGAPSPQATITGPATICSGQTVNLTSNTVSGATYQWSGGASATTQNIVASPSSTTAYYLVINDGVCSSAADTHIVNVLPSPVPLISGVTAICSGQSTTLAASGGTSYQWSGGSSATTSSITVSPVTTTVYSVTASNGTCTSQPVAVTVQVTPMPTASISASSQTICSGQPAVLTASGGSSYQWSGGVTSTSQSVTVSPSVTTAYYLTAVNGSCTSSPDTVMITVLPSPTPSVNGVTSICSGHSTTLAASGGTSYQWSGGSSATTSSITVSPVTTTVYYVTVSNGTCMSQPLQTTVQVIPVPVASVSGSTTICSGQSTTLTANGGSSYQWNTGDTTQSITVNPSSTTTYYVTVANGNCYSAPLQVTVNVTPFQGAGITGPSVICANSNAILNASGGGTYLWSTGATNSSITVNPSATTTYSVVVTNSSGCTDTAFHTLNVNPPPFVNAGSDVTICAGDTVQLNGAFSGSTFYWTPNTNISSIWPVNPWVYPTATTTYVMVGMSQNDCGGTDSVTVIVSPCTGIEEASASHGMILAPNPADGYFDIYLEQPLKDGIIELYNAQGAIVLRMAGDLELRNRVDVTGLAKGLYLVRITAGKTIKTAQAIIE